MTNIVDLSQGRIGTEIQHTDLHGHRTPCTYVASVAFSRSAHDEEETNNKKEEPSTCPNMLCRLCRTVRRAHPLSPSAPPHGRGETNF